jgi:hypothetical protein
MRRRAAGLEMGKKSVGISTNLGDGIELVDRGLCHMRVTRDAAGKTWFTLVDASGKIVSEGKLASADMRHDPEEGAT